MSYFWVMLCQYFGQYNWWIPVPLQNIVLCTNPHCKAMGYFSQSVSDFHYFIIMKCTSVDTTDTLCYRFTQDKTDQFDWVRNSLKTQSSQTGPSSDHTYGTDKGEILTEIYWISLILPPSTSAWIYIASTYRLWLGILRVIYLTRKMIPQISLQISIK